MDIDDEDDFYAPEEPQAAAQPAPAEAPATKKDASEELESGEEEDEGGAMDEDEDSVGDHTLGRGYCASTDHHSRISTLSRSEKTPPTHHLHRELVSSHHYKWTGN